MILSSLLQANRSRVSIARTANDLYTKEMKLIAVVDQILDEEIKVHLDLLSVTILAKWILERWQRLDLMSQHLLLLWSRLTASTLYLCKRSSLSECFFSALGSWVTHEVRVDSDISNHPRDGASKSTGSESGSCPGM